MRAEEQAKQRSYMQAMNASNGQGGAPAQAPASSPLQQGLGAVADKAGGFLGGALAKGLSGILGGGSTGSSLWDKSASIGPSTWMSGFGIK